MKVDKEVGWLVVTQTLSGITITKTDYQLFLLTSFIYY